MCCSWPRYILILWDSIDVPLNTIEHVYTWNGYVEKDSVFSILKYVDTHSERLRSEYLAWIYELGESEIHGKRLIDLLVIEEGLSYWWMTSLVEKNPWRSPVIIDAIRIFALEEIIIEQGPVTLKLVSANKKLHKILFNLCKKLNVSYEWEHVLDHSLKKRDIKSLRKKTPSLMQGIFTLLRYVISRWSLKSTNDVSWFSGEKTLFICSYFFNLNAKRAEDGDYYSQYWGDLGDLLEANNLSANWLQLYHPSDQVPNTKIAKHWVKKFNKQKKGREFHAFLDTYLSWKIILRVLRNWLKLSCVNLKLSGVKNLYRPDGYHFTLWPIMRDEWESSMSGSYAIINFLWIELFNAALKNIPHQKKGLYLLENHAWERAFIHAWRKHGHGQLTGVVHSTVRFWDLRLYYDQKMYHSSTLYPIPHPDITALNGKVAVDAFINVGFPREKIVECEALRYGYIGESIDDCHLNKKTIDDSKSVLILGDYLPEGTIKMLRLLEEAAPYISSEINFIAKSHPNYLIQPADYPSLNLKVVTESLAEIIQDYDIAYSSNMTSASVDAYLSGIPVLVKLDDSELNFSPLRGQIGVHFVNTPLELAEILNSISQGMMMESITTRDFFFLDPELSRWKKIL